MAQSRYHSDLPQSLVDTLVSGDATLRIYKQAVDDLEAQVALEREQYERKQAEIRRQSRVVSFDAYEPPSMDQLEAARARFRRVLEETMARNLERSAANVDPFAGNGAIIAGIFVLGLAAAAAYFFLL